MAITEVFQNPTVKQVVFQIRYPNLFFIESRIGELQLKIMKEFPESNLLFRRQVVFVDAGPDAKIDELPSDLKEQGKKIWQFKSSKGYNLSVTNDSLDITSEYHKTYNNPSSDNKFRDVIKLVLDSFFSVIAIPIINRIGLRYIDECPVPSKDNETFSSFYNTNLPINRFNISDAKEMLFRCVTSRGDYNLGYVELFKMDDKEYKLILDFDGYANDINTSDCLDVLDRLHDLIADEFEKTIKEPVYEYMRRKDA